jgi:hypothetical protein
MNVANFRRMVFCWSRIIGLLLVLSGSIRVHPWQGGLAVAASVVVEPQVEAAAKALDKAKEEARSFRETWDKAKLEATLYDKRAKRAYEKWVKAAKGLRKEAEVQKGKAETELKLSTERRKLAYNEWQAALYRQALREAQLKLAEQERDIAIVKERIRKLEKEVGTSAPAKP